MGQQFLIPFEFYGIWKELQIFVIYCLFLVVCLEEKVENLGEKEAVSGSVGLARGWLAASCTLRETMGILSENVALDPWALRSARVPETQLWALPFPLVSHSAPVTIGRTLRHALGKGVQAVSFYVACVAITPLVQHAASGLRHKPWRLSGAQSLCDSLDSGLAGLRSESAWHLSPWDSSPEVTTGQSGESSQPGLISPIKVLLLDRNKPQEASPAGPV